ncbi:hypothetical protein LCGC14_0614750 [marine sediment metagenome]|uniref:Uncharacterized protein n=1 Tax=marine sediment metagenome TaxID=412755 RepID=A0A0F9R6S4_9ZZZZ
MIVANFTPDTILWTHIGVTGRIKPGEIVEMAEPRAKHILNKYGSRGLVQLQYDDDKKEKARDAKIIYEDFWVRQIVNFNQLNERRKNENKAYLDISPELAFHAKQLELEVVGPWKMTKASSSKEMEELKTDNNKLRDEIGSFKEQVGTLTNQVETLIGKMTKEFDTKVGERDVYLRQFKNKGAAAFKAWVKNTNKQEEIKKDWPVEMQNEIIAKWESHFKEDKLPFEF